MSTVNAFSDCHPSYHTPCVCHLHPSKHQIIPSMTQRSSQVRFIFLVEPSTIFGLLWPFSLDQSWYNGLFVNDEGHSAHLLWSHSLILLVLYSDGHLQWDGLDLSSPPTMMPKMLFRVLRPQLQDLAYWLWPMLSINLNGISYHLGLVCTLLCICS